MSTLDFFYILSIWDSKLSYFLFGEKGLVFQILLSNNIFIWVFLIVNIIQQPCLFKWSKIEDHISKFYSRKHENALDCFFQVYYVQIDIARIIGTQ